MISSDTAIMALALRRVVLSKVLNLNGTYRLGIRHQIAGISTTEKKKETPSTITDGVTPKAPVTAEDFADVKTKRNWISYGYSTTDREMDEDYHKVHFFMCVTVCLCGLTFIFMYLPDFKMQDWTMREARLELLRREKLGLPRVDRNLIDPARIELPSDEELGDTEIIL